PYAYGALSAHAKAIDAYEDSRAKLWSERNAIDETIVAISQNELIDALFVEQPTDEMSWFRRLEELPITPATRYLHELIAQHAFQEGFKNLRDLVFMRGNLESWRQNLEVFDHMLVARQARYARVLPQVRDYARGIDLVALRQQHQMFAAELNDIVSTNDVMALTSYEEAESWAMLNDIGRNMSAMSTTEANDLMRTKHRVLSGFSYWEANEKFPSRVWQTEKALKELDQGIIDIQASFTKLNQAHADARGEFSGFAQTIAQSKQHTASLSRQTVVLINEQAADLNRLAIEELQDRKLRLDGYLSQVQYALATIYDQAAHQNLIDQQEAAVEAKQTAGSEVDSEQETTEEEKVDDVEAQPILEPATEPAAEDETS
ncbi:MAG: hypothetical protein HKM24_03330, partial [Gammaproteobacteria bacterium]|nr:hypothetical protein [Gammaproteobacteria bacterium]